MVLLFVNEINKDFPSFNLDEVLYLSMLQKVFPTVRYSDIFRIIDCQLKRRLVHLVTEFRCDVIDGYYLLSRCIPETKLIKSIALSLQGNCLDP